MRSLRFHTLNQWVSRIKADNLILLLWLSLLAFAQVTFYVMMDYVVMDSELSGYDRLIVDGASQLASPLMILCMLWITTLGSPYLVLGTSAILFISFTLGRRYRSALLFLLSPGGGLFLTGVMKDLMDRARPMISHPIYQETGYSFPSGHATVAVCFYGLLIYWIISSAGRPLGLQKRMLVGALFLLILAIGVSRVYLGVHFPSDVLGGFYLGLFWLSFCLWLSRGWLLQRLL